MELELGVPEWETETLVCFRELLCVFSKWFKVKSAQSKPALLLCTVLMHI